MLLRLSTFVMAARSWRCGRFVRPRRARARLRKVQGQTCLPLTALSPPILRLSPLAKERGYISLANCIATRSHCFQFVAPHRSFPLSRLETRLVAFGVARHKYSPLAAMHALRTQLARGMASGPRCAADRARCTHQRGQLRTSPTSGLRVRRNPVCSRRRIAVRATDGAGDDALPGMLSVEAACTVLVVGAAATFDDILTAKNRKLADADEDAKLKAGTCAHSPWACARVSAAPCAVSQQRPRRSAPWNAPAHTRRQASALALALFDHSRPRHRS